MFIDYLFGLNYSDNSSYCHFMIHEGIVKWLLDYWLADRNQKNIQLQSALPY